MAKAHMGAEGLRQAMPKNRAFAAHQLEGDALGEMIQMAMPLIRSHLHRIREPQANGGWKLRPP